MIAWPPLTKPLFQFWMCLLYYFLWHVVARNLTFNGECGVQFNRISILHFSWPNRRLYSLRGLELQWSEFHSVNETKALSLPIRSMVKLKDSTCAWSSSLVFSLAGWNVKWDSMLLLDLLKSQLEPPVPPSRRDNNIEFSCISSLNHNKKNIFPIQSQDWCWIWTPVKWPSHVVVMLFCMWVKKEEVWTVDVATATVVIELRLVMWCDESA